MKDRKVKVNGINKCYSVEVEKGVFAGEQGVAITLRDASGNEMVVAVSEEDWEKIREIQCNCCPNCGAPIDWEEAEPMCDQCGWAE